MDKHKQHSHPAGAERRRFTRFKSLSILQLLREDDQEFGHKPTLVNMSEGGLCFYCDDPLKTNDRLKININITEFNCTVATYARIVWSQRSTEHVGSHFTGVEFVGLDETDREIIRRLEKANRRKR